MQSHRKKPQSVRVGFLNKITFTIIGQVPGRSEILLSPCTSAEEEAITITIKPRYPDKVEGGSFCPTFIVLPQGLIRDSENQLLC